MNTVKVIIYGTGLLGQELLQQIECYNRIQNEQFVEVEAFTESENRGGG